MKKSDFQEYNPRKPLKRAFDQEHIPMLLMRQLRNLDFPISRRISYERTVDEFLLQLAVNDSLRMLRQRQDMVILLNEEGALIREAGKWSLLFTPTRGEDMTLEVDAELFPVYQKLLEEEAAGRVCRVEIPERSLKVLAANAAPFCILDEYCKNYPGGYLSVAEMIVYVGADWLYEHVPVCRFNKMATVDRDEIESYHTIKALLDDYILRYDASDEKESVQPLSVAVFGPPGSGKSFGVKQIAASCGRYQVFSLNVSQYKGAGELFEALDEALKSAGDQIPLIFFDEFDSELEGTSRGWLKYFLAPMQDGEYTLKGKINTVKGAVFVFAGGTASSFQGFLPQNPEETERFRKIKGMDFVSRLKGVLNIKGINPVNQRDRAHIIRRAMILRGQLERNIPGVFTHGDSKANVSRALLSALLRVSFYRHGARSLEFILAMCRLSDVDRFTPSCLPLDEQLDIHLDVKDFQQKLTFEQVMGDMVEIYAKNAHENYRQKHLEEARKLGAGEETFSKVREEAEMADWDKLDEYYKESYRSQIRYLGEKLEDYETDIGIRPVVDGEADTIAELYGPVLEELAQMEHMRWNMEKLKDGWKYGNFDPELKQSPEIVPYEELDPKTKEFIRKNVREVPQLLKAIGYELYYKAF